MHVFSCVLFWGFGIWMLASRFDSDYSTEYNEGGDGGVDDNVPLTPQDFENSENLSPDDLDGWFESAEGDDYEDDVGPKKDIPTSATDKFEGDIVFPPGTNIWSFVDHVEAGGTEGEADDYDLPNVPLESAKRGSRCVYKGIIVHEMMHAAGFFHEQSREDRDSYIKVKWDNILKGVEGNFNKYFLTKIDHLGTKYDCDSIMHYGPNAFSKNGRRTIVAKTSECKGIGQRKGLSTIDKLDLNKLYNCSATGILEKIILADSCNDRNSYCKSWATKGYCDSCQSYMHKSCAKACNKCCSNDKLHCKDGHRYCEIWANRGECSRSPRFMQSRCKKACNQCSGQCKDTVTSCGTFKEYCTDDSFKHFMKKFCQKTCNLC